MEFLNFNKLNKIKPARGKVLISEPFINDEFFKRSIILLCEHNEDGTFGFVLNNYLDLKLSDLIEELPELNTKVSIGGPVNSDNLYYLHTLGDKLPGSLPVTDTISMGGDFNELITLMETQPLDESQIRFFVGYSGWEINQLESELEQNSWLVGEASDAELMDVSIEDLWKKILERMGSNYSMIAKYPEDPNLN